MSETIAGLMEQLKEQTDGNSDVREGLDLIDEQVSRLDDSGISMEEPWESDIRRLVNSRTEFLLVQLSDGGSFDARRVVPGSSGNHAVFDSDGYVSVEPLSELFGIFDSPLVYEHVAQ